MQVQCRKPTFIPSTVNQRFKSKINIPQETPSIESHEPDFLPFVDDPAEDLVYRFLTIKTPPTPTFLKPEFPLRHRGSRQGSPTRLQESRPPDLARKLA